MLYPRTTTLVATLALGLHVPAYAQTNEDDTPTRDVELETIVVEGEYFPPHTTMVGSRFSVPANNIAQTVQLIPDSLFQAQGAVHISDILANISGGSTNRGLVGTYNPYRIRGQEAGLIVNGNRNRFYDLDYGLHMIERVEVLKGPASTYYGVAGQRSHGGIINLVTKKPESEFGSAAVLRLSDQGTRLAWGDITGPLGDGGFSFRLLADVERSDTFVDNGFIDREGIAGSLRYDNDGRFRLLLEGDVRNRRTPFHVGLPLYGTVEGRDDLRLPRSLDIGEPSLPDSRFADGNGHLFENRMLTLTPEYDLTDTWTIKGTGRYQTRRLVENFAFPLGLQEDNRSLDRLLWIYPEDDEEYIGVVDLLGNFDIGGLEQNIVIGVDYGSFRAESEDFIFGSLPAIDVSNPAYGQQPTDVASIGYTNYYSELDTRAAYANGLFSLTDRLKFSAGVRFDDIDQETDSDGTDFAEADIEEVSPRFGMTFEFVEGLIGFAGWGEAISPQLPNPGVTKYVPETSSQYEVGIKFDYDRVTGTVALFDLERDGISLNDPLTLLPNFIGAQRTRGLDFDFAIRVSSEWTLLANYAYIDNQTTHDRFTKSNEGNALPGVPEHSGRIWTIYDIAGGALNGLSLQASITFASSRAGDVPNTYEVGGYEVVDAAARYPLSDRAWLQVNVQNLFDERYFNPGTGFNEGFVTPGEPRSFFVTLEYSY